MSRFVIKPITMTFENGGDFKIDIFSNFSRSWYLLLCKLNIPSPSRFSLRVRSSLPREAAPPGVI